jgi:hypothetical protein
MSKDHEKKKEKQLAYPWRNLHGAVWLIGLAYLFITGNWWPGILFLVAFSMLLEAVIMLVFPQSVEPEKPEPMEKTVPFSAPVDAGTVNVASAAPVHSADRLPNTCPRCGAPVRGHEVRWTSNDSADCMFCGSNIPMRK